VTEDAEGRPLVLGADACADPFVWFTHELASQSV
jgi:hypothetical protein